MANNPIKKFYPKPRYKKLTLSIVIARFSRRTLLFKAKKWNRFVWQRWQSTDLTTIKRVNSYREYLK